MAKLDARFCGLDAASETFNDQVMFDRIETDENNCQAIPSDPLFNILN